MRALSGMICLRVPPRPASGQSQAADFGTERQEECLRGVVLVLGALGDRFGLRLAFTVSAAVPLLGLPFLLLFPRRHANGGV